MELMIVMIISEVDGEAFNFIVCRCSKTSELKGFKQDRSLAVRFLTQQIKVMNYASVFKCHKL